MKMVNNSWFIGSSNTGTGGGGGTASGDVVGPVFSTDNAVARFDGTTGKLIQNTTNFTCDDNANIKIGDSTTDVDRTLHLQGKQNVVLFMESDSDNVGTETNKIILQKDSNKLFSLVSLTGDITTSSALNFETAHSNEGGIADSVNDDIVFRIGGQYTTPSEGNFVTSYSSNPTEVLRLDNSDKSVNVTRTLKVNTIQEYTLTQGLTIETIKFENGYIQFPLKSSNPGFSNNIWQRTDGHLMRSNVDLEDTGGDLFGPVSSLDNSIPIYDTTSGKLLKDSEIIVDTSSTSLRAQVEPGSLGYGSSNTIFGNRALFKSNGASTTNNVVMGGNILVTGAASTPGIPLSSNVIFGSNALQNTVISGGSFSQNILIGSTVCRNSSTTVGGSFVGNVVIGDNAGDNLTNNSQYNILIDNEGINQESNTIRIGNSTDHTKAHISGIYNTMEPATNSTHPMAISNDGQLSRYMMPMAELSFANFTTPILLSIPVQNQFYEMALSGLTFTTNKSQKWSNPSNGRIQWNGNYTVYVHCAFSFSMEVSTNNEILELHYRKNGVLIPNSTYRNKFGSGGEYQTVATHLLIQMSPGDELSVWITNTTGVGNTLDVGNFNMVGIAH